VEALARTLSDLVTAVQTDLDGQQQIDWFSALLHSFLLLDIMSVNESVQYPARINA
jgi:hypothetical protein